jgi:hypothetical protein
MQTSLVSLRNRSSAIGRLAIELVVIIIIISFFRFIPDIELEAVSLFFTAMFSCDIDALPTDALIHTFWTQMSKHFSASSSYVQCLKQRVRSYRARICDRLNPWYCGSRFGEEHAEQKLEQCRKSLAGDSGTGDMPKETVKLYDRYRRCHDQIRSQVI